MMPKYISTDEAFYPECPFTKCFLVDLWKDASTYGLTASYSPVIISLYLKQIATEMVLMQYCIDVCTI